MACLLTDTITNACTSGIGKVQDPILLLQIIAQSQADILLVAAPGTAVTPAAIQARACTSGIGKEQNPITLLQFIAQLNCDSQ